MNIITFTCMMHLYIYKEEGAVREPVGGGKTGKLICLICIYIYYIYKEEGAVREPVGGGRRGNSFQIE